MACLSDVRRTNATPLLVSTGIVIGAITGALISSHMHGVQTMPDAESQAAQALAHPSQGQPTMALRYPTSTAWLKAARLPLE